MKKILFLFVVMLGTLGAYAQSSTTPIKGDVNEDGVVDVADIVAIIDIMMNGGGTSGETMYYWYVGTTMPSNPLSAEENTGLNKWTSLGTTLPTSDIEVAKRDESYERSTWYIAAPTDAGFVLYNATNAASDEVGWDKSIININGVSYTLWTSRVTSFQAVEYLHYEGNTKYYWYIGLKKPTTSTNPILDLARFSNDSSWHKIWDELDAYNATNMLYNGSSASIYLNWEDTTFYLALPVGIGIYDDKGNNVTSEYTLESSDITIAGEKYNVYSGFASTFTHSLY